MSNSVPPSLVIINFQNSISHIKYDIDDNVNAFGFEKNNQQPPGRFSAPVTQEWRQDWHRILLVAHSCYRSLSRRSPAPLCHLTEPPVAGNSCALSLFLRRGGGRFLVTSYRTISPHGHRTVLRSPWGQYSVLPHRTVLRQGDLRKLRIDY